MVEEIDSKSGDDSSHLKFHFLVKNIEITWPTRLFRKKLIKELEEKVGSVQRDWIHIKSSANGRASVLFGLKFDSDAERLLRRRVTITVPGNKNAKLEPTDVFKALLDFKVQKRPVKRASNSRSRSPRMNAPVLLLLFIPNHIKNQDIFEAVSDLGVRETPKIEYVFTDLHELGTKSFIKLTFQHMHSVERLSKAELVIKGQPVLMVEPSLKQNLEKSVLHAIPHHQVIVHGAGAEHEEAIREAMEKYGHVAKVHFTSNYCVVTYTQLRSAKNALRDQSYNDEQISVTFSNKDNK